MTTERKRTRNQEIAYTELMLELVEQERWMDDYRRRQTLIPAAWHEMETLSPIAPKQAKLTLRIDADTLRWFRGMGRGWHARMAAVLRSYMLSVVSKEIEGALDRDWKGDPL